LYKNLHVLKVKGHRIRLEEIVSDHARARVAEESTSGREYGRTAMAALRIADRSSFEILNV